MNVFARHLRGLTTFNGRENREPFWLWVLIVYLFHFGVSMVISIPIMMASVGTIMPRMQADPTAAQRDPALMFRAMMPMMQQMMTIAIVLAVLKVALLAAAVVRRLHDGDRSGWWATPIFAWQIAAPIVALATFPKMMATIAQMRPDHPILPGNPAFQAFGNTAAVQWLGVLLLLLLAVFLALPGTDGPNRYGDDPLETKPRR